MSNITPSQYETVYTIKGFSSNLNLISVDISVKNKDNLSSIDFILPAWRPGRYQIQNYASNVQSFSAKRKDGELLHHEKINKQTWRVSTKGSDNVIVSYHYYAGGQIDAGNSFYDRDMLYFNGSNLFMYTKETRYKPCLLNIQAPKEWKIATSLEALLDEGFFLSRTYDELIDSPTIVSPNLIKYLINVRGVETTICFSNNRGLDGEIFKESKIKKDIAKIMESQFDLMRNVPLKKFLFIYQILPISFWHGVEHKTSTSIVMGDDQSMDTNYERFLSITSHEFFHVWNVKRLIPSSYTPYDYTKEQYSRLLFFSEGFTSYFGNLVLARAKLISFEKYIDGLAKKYTLLKNSQGAKIQSVAQASFDAWLSGYGKGRLFSTVSFYQKGEIIGLLLDLEIRKRTQNKYSLETVMRNLFEKFSNSQHGFTEKDFQTELEENFGSFSDFFSDYIYGTKDIDISPFIMHVGLDVKKDSKARLGTMLEEGQTLPTVKYVVPNSTAHKSMIYPADIIIAINNKATTSKESLRSVLSSLKPEEKISISIIRNDLLTIINTDLGSSDTYSFVPFDSLTDLQRSGRQSWVNFE